VRVDPNTLASIIEVEGYGLIPVSAEQRMQAALEIRATLQTAASDDEGSRAIRSRIRSVEQLLGDDARRRLADLPILWCDSSLPHAAAVEIDNASALLVCRGLFDLVHFQTSLDSVCNLLLQAEARHGLRGDPEQLPSGRMNLAGYVILADAYSNLRPPATIADMLGPKALTDVDIGVSTSLVLLLLHELGHVALGHTRARTAGDGAAINAVADPGDGDARVRLELEADAFSLDSVVPEWRAQLLASVISLHNVFRFFEVFGVVPSQEYPSADQRLAALMDRMPLSAADRAFADVWLDDYRRRQRTIAAPPATAGDMIDRFDRTMDAATAYRTVDAIRADLAASGIVLEKPES